jgi:acetyltransferase
MRSLEPLFFPASVTVVGASPRRSSLAGAVLRNLVLGGYRGTLNAVHPAGGHLLGVPVHTTCHDLPAAPEMAVIGVPPRAAETAVRDLLTRGTRAFLVLTAGLGEANGIGRDREDSLAARCREAGAVLLGPNCLGLHVLTSQGRLDATFARDLPIRGDTAVISQSGSIGEWFFSRMAERGLGAALLASVGNEADLDVIDLVEGAVHHLPHLRQLWLYLESPPPPDRLTRALAKLPAACRVFTIRGALTPAGRSAPGARALAEGKDGESLTPWPAPGEVASLTEALDLLEVVDRLPAPSGVRVAVVTNAGGPSVLAAAALHAGGLELPSPTKALAHRLAPLLPRGSHPRNPLDLRADAPPELYRNVLQTLGRSGEYDATLVVAMHPVVTDGPILVDNILEGIAAGPPATVVWLGGIQATVEEAFLRRAGCPVLPDPSRAGRALAAWASL